ncbi:SGNH/GDSL hydrolase family protein [Patescibacteria group bacterium]|nr:SGNH/GDSL hydrolase family protein [Patescibacteria group bacterium]
MRKQAISKTLLILIIIVYLFDFLIIFFDKNPQIYLEHILAYPIYTIKYAKNMILKQHPPIKPKNTYTIALAGDSMTDALRDAEFQLQNFFIPFYQRRNIRVLNYGFSSTNVLSVPDRLLEETVYLTKTYPPLLSSDLDLVIIESFGNNPLSEFSLEAGLKKQNEVLDQIIKLIQERNPTTLIVFLATVAPSKRYGEGVIDLKPEQRIKWKTEREEYIKNHIAYAKSHRILLIDLYNKTKDIEETPYISQSDYIHPSNEGLIFINKEIAEFIIRNRLLPI